MSEDILRGIENKTLRNLLTLWYNIFYNMFRERYLWLSTRVIKGML